MHINVTDIQNEFERVPKTLLDPTLVLKALFLVQISPNRPDPASIGGA